MVNRSAVLIAIFLSIVPWPSIWTMGLPLGEQNPIPARILRYENVQADHGYKFEYKTSDGQTREETGNLLNQGNDLVVHGSYSFLGDDQKLYFVRYTADRNGYNPTVLIGAEEVNQDLETVRPPLAPEISITPAVHQNVIKSLLG